MTDSTPTPESEHWACGSSKCDCCIALRAMIAAITAERDELHQIADKRGDLIVEQQVRIAKLERQLHNHDGHTRVDNPEGLYRDERVQSSNDHHIMLSGKSCEAEREGVNGVTVDTHLVSGNAEVTPHVHEPAGPGEYCDGCFDQGAVWAEHEERSRVRQIIEGVRSLHTPSVSDIDEPVRNTVTREVCDALLAAIYKGGADDA